MKLQLIGNIESPEEKMYLEKKINEIKSPIATYGMNK